MLWHLRQVIELFAGTRSGQRELQQRKQCHSLHSTKNRTLASRQRPCDTRLRAEWTRLSEVCKECKAACEREAEPRAAVDQVATGQHLCMIVPEVRLRRCPALSKQHFTKLITFATCRTSLQVSEAHKLLPAMNLVYMTLLEATCKWPCIHPRGRNTYERTRLC